MHNQGDYFEGEAQKHISPFFTTRTPQFIQSSPFQPARGRFSSFNSTFLSPLQLNRSPELSSQIHDIDNIVELQLDKEPSPPEPERELRDRDDDSSSSEEESESIEAQGGLFDIKSIIETVVNNVAINEHELEKRRTQLKQAAETRLLEVFDMLVRRMRKVKKTKEEMVKYCMRKVFRHIGSKSKKSNGRDVSQALREYFGNDKGFDVPFKRNSSDKTMNAAFLTKVFSCPIFVADYKHYIKNLQYQAQKDNSKKVKALAKAIEKLGNIGTPKQLESLRRLPWTQLIINKVVELSENLLTYAGEDKQKEGQLERERERIMEQRERERETNQVGRDTQTKESKDAISHSQKHPIHEGECKTQQVYIPKKMSVIILTPPVGPLESLIKLEDIPRLDDS